MLSKEYVNRVTNLAFGLLKDFNVIFDDERQMPIPISRYEIKDNYLKVLGYLQDDVVGNIKEIQVLMEDDSVAMVKEYNLTKTKAHGVMVAFVLKITEEEVV